MDSSRFMSSLAIHDDVVGGGTLGSWWVPCHWKMPGYDERGDRCNRWVTVVSKQQR